MVPKTLSFSRFLFAGLLLAGYASAESKWTYMHSENLDVYSESSPVRSQETIRAFEQIRAFIVKSIAPRDGSLGPVCVVAFKAEEDFAHFRHFQKTPSVSFALPGTDRDYLVMGVPEADSVNPATRAYTEILTRQLGLNLPSWLDEGLTSFYATFTVRGGDVIAGDMTPERRKTFYSEAVGSLTPVLSAPANSRTQLNQRFVLVHMLLLSKDYAPKFKDLVAALQSGTGSQKALETVYGKPLADIEKDLKAYSVSGAFVGTALSTGSNSLANSLGEPASSFDVNLVLAGITNQPGRERDAEAWYDRLSTMSPERPEPWAGLGYIAVRRNQLDVAEKNFEKAISLGSRDTALLWTASRILHRDSTKDTADSVRKLLDREPTRADLRVRLAALELDQRRPGVAYSLLEPVKDVPNDLSARFLSELAYSQLGTGEKSAAKLTVARLDDRVSSASDKAEVKILKDYLAGPTHMTLGSKSADPQGNTEQLAAEAQRLAKEKELADAQKSAKDKELADAHDRELAAAREKEGANVIEKATIEARLKAEARDKEKAEADQRAQAEQAARVKALTEAREKALADAQEKKDAKAKEKADREAQALAAADARQKAAAEAREKALADAQEKQEAKAREKADVEARDKAIQEAHLKVAQAAQQAHDKEAADAREKAETDARLKIEARNRAEAEIKAKADADAKAKVLADAKAKADADARQKAAQEPTVLAKAAKETRASAEAAAQPQQASNLVSDNAAAAHTFPSMLSGQFIELGCGDQIKVVVQTEQGKKNFRIKNPANVIVSGKSGGTVDLNCGPQTPSKVRIQYGPGEGGFDGQVEAIYFE